jgi:DNA-binding MarR family transcriptional regulator
VGRVSAFRNFEENENINVSFNDFLVIEALYTNPKIHQRDLAKILFRGTANLSRDLEKLEKRGLIQRALETKNNRVVKTLLLTEEGEKVFHEVSALSSSHVKEIESIFTPEEHEQFLSYIIRLRNRLTETVGNILE